jgi:hypothetical protein
MPVMDTRLCTKKPYVLLLWACRLLIRRHLEPSRPYVRLGRQTGQSAAVGQKWTDLHHLIGDVSG